MSTAKNEYSTVQHSCPAMNSFLLMSSVYTLPGSGVKAAFEVRKEKIKLIIIEVEVIV